LVVEVTSNTLGHYFFLRPCKESVEIYIGIIGRALEQNPAVRIHTLNPLSTHATELLSSDVPRQIPRYLSFVKNNLARELRRLHGIDSSLSIWENRRARAIPIAADEASLEARFRYCCAQGTKEDLVVTPYDWPGVTGVHSLTRGVPLKGWWYDRTREHEARAKREPFSKHTFATEYSVQLSPLPHWQGLEEAVWRRRAKAIIDDIADEAITRRGDRVLGAEAVMAFSPLHRGSGPERTRAPICHAVGKRAFKVLRAFIANFCEAFAAASESDRHGDGSIPYPPFAFPAARPMTPGNPEGFEAFDFFGAIGTVSAIGAT
jgi:hypothetical protein